MHTYDEESEEVFVLRHNNRAQRSVNRALRRAINRHQKHTDELFLELCKSDNSAEFALERIWSEVKLDCDLTDYDTIASKCIDALKKVSIE